MIYNSVLVINVVFIYDTKIVRFVTTYIFILMDKLTVPAGPHYNDMFMFNFCIFIWLGNLLYNLIPTFTTVFFKETSSSKLNMEI
jgi:hypothetical protein